MANILRSVVYKSKFLGNFLQILVTNFQFKLLSFYKDEKITKLIQSIAKETDLAFFPYEAFMVYSIAKSQSCMDGEMAEVGVFRGGSAKLICEAKGNKKLHLFDTFEGLPEVSDKDTHFGIKFWKTSQFGNTSVELVKNYLSKYQNVYFYKGKFPETAKPILNSKFSFVHLDVDLYESTLDCLEFFYPRMISGGIILTHDYHTQGVKSAFKEFVSGKKISLIELTGSQCIVIKN